MITRYIERIKLPRFAREKSGAIAVEAAFILPGMIMIWLGMITLIDMQKATTSVGKVSSTVADILAQTGVINVPAIDCSFQAADSLLSKNAGSDLEIYVVGVNVFNSESTVEWARGKNLSFKPLPPKGQPYDELPADLLTEDGFYVISHARLNHKPLFGDAILENETVAYDYKNYFIPRISNDVICTDCEELRTTPTLPCN